MVIQRCQADESRVANERNIKEEKKKKKRKKPLAGDTTIESDINGTAYWRPS